MKFGLVPVHIDVRRLEQTIGLATAVEHEVFESVWTLEHVIVPVEYQSRYPYNASGSMNACPETNPPEGMSPPAAEVIR